MHSCTGHTISGPAAAALAVAVSHMQDRLKRIACTANASPDRACHSSAGRLPRRESPIDLCSRRRLALTEIATELLDACLAANPRDSRGIGCDNMTAVIVRIKPPLLRQPTSS